MWILARTRSSRSRSGRSSATAQSSPSPTVSTPSWTAIASLSFPMVRWPSLVAPTSYFAKGEKISEDKLSSEVFSDGVLAELAAQTGDASKERLMEIARTAYFRWSFCSAWIQSTFLSLQPHQRSCSSREQQNKTLKRNFARLHCFLFQ